jgi:hypothetical protein
MKKIILFSLFIFSSTFVFSQNEVVKFTNPSFEGMPKAGELPSSWMNIGPNSESPADTQPGFFKCTKEAFDGETYLGMVVRDHGTKEGVSQRLKGQLLEANIQYTFDITLAKSEEYVSRSFITGDVINYDAPCVLKIWIGNSYFDKNQLIYKSIPIKNTEWEKYKVKFSPLEDYDFILFELDFADEKKPNCGNMLIDDLSDIMVIEK